MLTLIFLALGVLALGGSLFFNAIAGAQIAVIGVGLLLISVIIELRKLNSFNTERLKSSLKRQSKSSNPLDRVRVE